MWKQELIETNRGTFEVFVKGEGEPLCVTHLYTEFRDLGNYFADMFINDFKVHLVNVKECGNSCKVEKEDELSMKEAVKDLEAIREAFGYEKWAFAGHSTGGMLGLVYGIGRPDSLTKLVVGGAAASYRYGLHEGSMYSSSCPLNPRLKEIFKVLYSQESTIEERRAMNREWINMSLYKPDRFDEYFAKPSSGKVVSRRLTYFSKVDYQTFDIVDQLHRITTPTFVYCGRFDAQCPLFFSEEIHQNIAGSRLYIFEESNHSPFLEEKECFKELVQDFKRIK